MSSNTPTATAGPGEAPGLAAPDHGPGRPRAARPRSRQSGSGRPGTARPAARSGPGPARPARSRRLRTRAPADGPRRVALAATAPVGTARASRLRACDVGSAVAPRSAIIAVVVAVVIAGAPSRSTGAQGQVQRGRPTGRRGDPVRRGLLRGRRPRSVGGAEDQRAALPQPLPGVQGGVGRD